MCNGPSDVRLRELVGKRSIVAAMAELQLSFPDFTVGRFADPAAGVTSPTLGRDGAWTATASVTGTHTGDAFAPRQSVGGSWDSRVSWY